MVFQHQIISRQVSPSSYPNYLFRNLINIFFESVYFVVLD